MENNLGKRRSYLAVSKRSKTQVKLKINNTSIKFMIKFFKRSTLTDVLIRSLNLNACSAKHIRFE